MYLKGNFNWLWDFSILVNKESVDVSFDKFLENLKKKINEHKH